MEHLVVYIKVGSHRYRFYGEKTESSSSFNVLGGYNCTTRKPLTPFMVLTFLNNEIKAEIYEKLEKEYRIRQESEE